MAIDTAPLEQFEYPGEEETGGPPRVPPAWRRSAWLRPHVLWAIVGACWATCSGTGWATSSPADTTQVQAAARTTWPSSSGSRWAWSAGWRASAA